MWGTDLQLEDLCFLKGDMESCSVENGGLCFVTPYVRSYWCASAEHTALIMYLNMEAACLFANW
jgi:hypothetical protein